MGSVARKAGGAVLRSTYRFTLRDVPTRRELPHVLNARGLVGCGVEVGFIAVHALTRGMLMPAWA